jgi:zinc transporter, ZIP family
MGSEGRSGRIAVITWLACALLLALAVVLGRAIGGGLSDELLAVALGFAGGAVLASLADT